MAPSARGASISERSVPPACSAFRRGHMLVWCHAGSCPRLFLWLSQGGRMRALAVWGTTAGFLVGCYASPSWADPPDGADPALAPWFRSLTQPGTHQPCCSLADCRTVQYRIVGDHFQAYIGEDF